jgi:hypothetical protein
MPQSKKLCFIKILCTQKEASAFSPFEIIIWDVKVFLNKIPFDSYESTHFLRIRMAFHIGILLKPISNQREHK